MLVVLAFTPGTAAKPDTAKISPQLANVVATSFVLKVDPIKITTKPEPNFDTDVLIPLRAKQAQATADAQRAATEAAAAQAAQQSTQTANVSPSSSPLPSGSHTDWMAAAGIAASDYSYVDYIVSHESGWDPTNWYGKKQGLPYDSLYSAAGLPQALPYGKTGCGWGDAICQLRWANSYAVSKYGSWYNAYEHWLAVSSW